MNFFLRFVLTKAGNFINIFGKQTRQQLIYGMAVSVVWGKYENKNYIYMKPFKHTYWWLPSPISGTMRTHTSDSCTMAFKRSMASTSNIWEKRYTNCLNSNLWYEYISIEFVKLPLWFKQRFEIKIIRVISTSVSNLMSSYPGLVPKGVVQIINGRF